MQITIDGKLVTAESGETILEAAHREKIDIPTLCHLPQIQQPNEQSSGKSNTSASCLACLVKFNGRFVPSCAVLVEEGMDIESETEEVWAMRKTSLELLLSNHIPHCRTCGEGRKKCKLLKLIGKYRLNRHRFGHPSSLTASTQTDTAENIRDSGLLQSDRVVYDARKCIQCGICVAITKKNGEELGLTLLGRGFETKVGVPFDEPLQKGIVLSEEEIISTCPTAAFTWRNTASNSTISNDTVHSE